MYTNSLFPSVCFNQIFLITHIFQAFSPICLPSLSYLNIRENPLEQNSAADLLDLLRRFPCLRSLEVVLIFVVTFFCHSIFLFFHTLVTNVMAFHNLRNFQVDIPGPLGGSAIEILEALPNISELNGISSSKILETGKQVIDSVLLPRLPEWTPDEPLADRIINAMWQYLMTYRLADEEKLDETSVWYDPHIT